MEELLKKAEALAGRPVEIENLSDGKYIVLWMRFNSSPPPKADTPEEALKGFIEMMERKTHDGSNTLSDGQSVQGS